MKSPRGPEVQGIGVSRTFSVRITQKFLFVFFLASCKFVSLCFSRVARQEARKEAIVASERRYFELRPQVNQNCLATLLRGFECHCKILSISPLRHCLHTRSSPQRSGVLINVITIMMSSLPGLQDLTAKVKDATAVAQQVRPFPKFASS